MSDLISRQDVYEILTEYYHHHTDIQHDALREALSRVPSAEPEPEGFEWCSRGESPCKEYDQEKHCCHRWTKVIRRTVEEMKTNWIWTPVTEALPKDMDRLLVTIVRSDGEKRVRSGHYYKGYFMMDNGDTWNKTDKEVLAWMPLPEPYKRGRK